MSERRRVAARTFLSRLNEGRTTWLAESELADACREFLAVNGYAVQQGVKFEGGSSYESPLTGAKAENASEELLAFFLCPRLEKYDIALFGKIESALYSVLDSGDNTGLILATDAFSYSKILANAELNVAVENLMTQGLFILFLNNASGHALFDSFDGLTKPIPV